MIAGRPLDALLRRMPELRPGHVWLAGAGPGDPGLLTLHAVSGLAQAEVVVHDALVDARVLDLAHPDAERVPAGKRGGAPSADQADISAGLVAFARQGRRVLRLKGGDPFIFGRGGEEVLTLAQHGIPFRVVPGVTSGLAALTAALIPATLRGVNQAVLLATGHGAAGPGATPGGGDGEGGLDWPALARLGQPIVLYMAITNLAAIARALMAGGLPGETGAAAVAWATTPRQRVLVSTLRDIAGDLAREGVQAPAIVVIGRIVATREHLLALLPALEEEQAWLPARAV